MAKIISNNNNNEAELEVDEGNESRDEGGESAKIRMKKGPWTPNEDSVLIDYVTKYGEGNWNSVQKNSGLSRCGKSCRLRWANHLRPNLKKGAFSEEEEKIIIELHSKLGNKWAQMAAQLFGRTDNEIKNFWNTRLKRCQRVGLAIYPSQTKDEGTSYLQLKKQHYSEQPFSSSSPSFSMLLSSCYPKKLDEQTQFSSLMNPLPTPPNPGNGNNNANLALQLSPYSSSSSTNFFNQSGPTNSTVPLVLSSSQSPPGSTTPDSSYTSGVVGLMRDSSMINDYYRVAPLSPQSNSGLLDGVVMEAKLLSHNNNNNGKSKSEGSTFARNKLSCKRKSMALEEYGGNKEENFTALLLESTMKKNTKDTTLETQTGKKLASEDPFVEMNSMDDDLFSLLNNFPSQTPTPEWYRRGGNSSHHHQSLGLETQATNNASSGPTDQEFAWSLGSGWMPGLC